jgi:hypothetical protein
LGLINGVDQFQQFTLDGYGSFHLDAVFTNQCAYFDFILSSCRMAARAGICIAFLRCLFVRIRTRVDSKQR